MNKAFIDGLKELARTVLLAIIPMILFQINTILPTLQQGWRMIVLVGVIAFLKGLDELLTAMGKGINGNGLTAF